MVDSIDGVVCEGETYTLKRDELGGRVLIYGVSSPPYVEGSQQLSFNDKSDVVPYLIQEAYFIELSNKNKTQFNGRKIENKDSGLVLELNQDEENSKDYSDFPKSVSVRLMGLTNILKFLTTKNAIGKMEKSHNQKVYLSFLKNEIQSLGVNTNIY